MTKPSLKKFIRETLKESGEKALVPFQQIAQSTNNVEDFMKMLVGKKLKDLLDAASFARVYVGNKYPIGGNVDEKDVQVLLSNLMSAATSFINFRKLNVLAKQRDAWESEQYSKPEYVAWKQKRSTALKNYLAAKSSGNQAAIEKATSEKDAIMSADPSLNDYRKMMSDKDAVVNQWHNTPLTIKDVLPDPDDGEEDKKNWGYVVKAFDALKSATKNESKIMTKNDIKALIQEVLNEEEYDTWRDSWSDAGGYGKPPRSWRTPSSYYRSKPSYNTSAKPSLTGKTLYFYNVPVGKESDALSAGLKQTKSGKWYSLAPVDQAEKLFGKGRSWQAK